jgi:hypothetical protein
VLLLLVKVTQSLAAAAANVVSGFVMKCGCWISQLAFGNSSSSYQQQH